MLEITASFPSDIPLSDIPKLMVEVPLLVNPSAVLIAVIPPPPVAASAHVKAPLPFEVRTCPEVPLPVIPLSFKGVIP